MAKSPTKKTATSKASVVKEDLVAKESVAKKDEIATAKKVEATKRKVIKEVSLLEIVTVVSNFYGQLSYTSKKNGYITEWSRYGEEQPMTVEELMTMRNTQRKFFERNWIRLVGDNAEDVIAFLQLERYFPKESANVDLEQIISMSPSEIRKIVPGLSASLRESLARLTMEKINAEELDSMIKITALEESCGFKLKADSEG